MADPGELRFEYFPLPANPLGVALLILLGLVTFVLGPLTARPEFWPLGGLCFVPFALLVVGLLASRPSPTRIYSAGIEVSRPRWRALLRGRSWLSWDDVVNVYPASYEIGGAAMSPFASSAGTLVHRGIGLETREGRTILIRFTPSAIRAFRGDTPGYTYAMEAIRGALAARGRPLVTSVRTYADDEILRMTSEARKPLVSIVGVIFAFFLPPALVAILLLILLPILPALTPAILALAAVVALAPPAVSIELTRRRAVRRNRLLGEIAKFQEWMATRGASQGT